MTEVEIVGLRAWGLREPDSRRATTVVQLTAKSGLKGYGECGEVPAEEINSVRSVVIGRPATARESVRQALKGSFRTAGAIDTAMLDLVGQQTKAPIFQILGGPTRNRARALACVEGATDEDVVAHARVCAAAGFRALMVPLPKVTARNQGKAFTESVKRRLNAIRAATDGEIVLDGGGKLTPGDAHTLAAELQDFHLLWFDEPCMASSLEPLRKISENTVTPIGLGRYMGHAGEFSEALREEVVDVLRPDLAQLGITNIRRTSALAETYYVAVAPHHHCGPIGTAAALHLAASLPNFFIQEVPVPLADRDRRMRAELMRNPIETVKDGFLTLPSGPGLGISVNEEALDKYKEWAI